MKKLLLITLAIGMLACSTSEEKNTNEPDCNCDRVVQANYFNVVGTPVSYHCVYYTINDCTQVQKQKSYTTTDEATLPQVGQCR